MELKHYREADVVRRSGCLNRTIVELKLGCQNQDADRCLELESNHRGIETDLGASQRSRRDGLNRTIVELKHDLWNSVGQNTNALESNHRGIETFQLIQSPDASATRLNRTIVELKQPTT